MAELPFDEAAAGKPPQTPVALGKIFNMPTGDMMEKLGIITPEQVAESGRKQGYMLAIRDAINAGTVAANNPLLPQFKGAPDFLGLAKKSDDDLLLLTEDLDISTVAVEMAQTIIETRVGVNQPGEKLQVPFIGAIHNTLYGNRDLSQASLCIQQAIRASDSAIRMQEGLSDPTAHAKKREFGFKNDKDDSRVKDAVFLHEAISTQESTTQPGKIVDVSNFKEALGAVFAAASDMFASAGKPEIAEKVKLVATHYTAQLKDAPGAAPTTPSGMA